MSFVSEVHVFTDGCSRGNPGPSAIAFIIYDSTETNILHKHGECIGHATNNIAEYRAVIKALEIAARYTRGNVRIYCDSELVVNQMNDSWKVKKEHILELYQEAKLKEAAFKSVSYTHMEREHEKIQEVDDLANQALDNC